MDRNKSIPVNPQIITWARETVGLSMTDVARAIRRSVEEIKAWESGVLSPTYPQLEKLAYQVFKRPIAVFFLPDPPDEMSPKYEFRTLPDADLNSLEKDTYIQIRKAHAFQLALEEIFGVTNPSKNKIWKILRISIEASVFDQAVQIRRYLNISLEEQTSWNDSELALKKWRQAIENSGVFVFKSAFKQKEISGFCLASDEFPLIYINNSTTKTRQLFSLMHELAHLLMHINGLTKFDGKYISELSQKTSRIESFCNAVAAEILIPDLDFQSRVTSLPSNIEHVAESTFSDLARRYSVSREAILRKFFDDGRVSTSFYDKKSREWNSQTKSSSSGGSYYANQNVYLSERFATEVIKKHYTNQITIESASELLGISPKNFPGIEQRILKREAL